MAPGARITCTALHTVTANDITAGLINNTAFATGNAPDGRPVTGTSNTTTVRINNLPPSIVCPAPVTVNTSLRTCDALINAGLAATFSDPNNNIASLTWVMTGATTAASPLTGINNLQNFTFNSGITTVTYTVTDIPGLSSTCSFTVTVIDNVPPAISCVAPQDRYTDSDGPLYTAQGTEFDPVVSDNCSISSVTNNFNGLSTLAGAQFPIGVTTVTWTVTDNSGNRATCNFTVTVTDNVAPVVRCKDITIYLDLVTGLFTITASDIDNGSFDNTGIETLTASLTNFNCSNLGPNNVTLTATDHYGNSGSCTAVVTVMYSVVPNPVVTPLQDVICNKEQTNFNLTNNIPNTTWTWTVISSSQISGATGDTRGNLTVINQVLTNSDTIVHNAIYSIIPRVYGRCDLPKTEAVAWVNPTPEIRVSSGDTVICNGESTSISVRNPNVSVRGQWIYDLKVIADASVSGYTSDGTYSSPANLNETLTNSDSKRQKVVYRFIPRIVSGNGAEECTGIEQKITIWVNPGIKYTMTSSDYNGFNISCFGGSDGHIRITRQLGSAPLTFVWKGPAGFTSTQGLIRNLSAGEYSVIITDNNNCSVMDTIVLTEPKALGMSINSSISADGAYNIDCANGKTGSIIVTAINNVGTVNYIWSDGYNGESQTNLPSGIYKIIITDANKCQAESSVTLTEPDLIKPVLEVTPPFCPDKPDGEIRLSVTGGIMGTDYTYRWSDNSTNRNLSNIPAGTYEVTIGDMNGCSVKASVRVDPMNDICLIIPGIISPNGDLINDVWNIGNIDLYPKMEVFIYNRWGQFIWRSEQGYAQPWNGTYNGKVLPMDSYHYAIDLHNGTKTIVGTITIVK